MGSLTLESTEWVSSCRDPSALGANHTGTQEHEVFMILSELNWSPLRFYYSPPVSHKPSQKSHQDIMDRGLCTTLTPGAKQTEMATMASFYKNIAIQNWRVQMQKPLSALWTFLLKWAFLSGPYIYVQLFPFNCIEKDALPLKLLNLNIAAW